MDERIMTASRVDPTKPVTEEEVLLVIRTHDTYLRGFTQRRVGLLSMAESIDDLIHSVSLRSTSATDDIRVQGGRSSYDTIYRIYETVEKQMKDQADEVWKGLWLLDAEERKFTTIWGCFMSADPEDVQLLTQLCYQKKSVKEIRAEFRGGIMSEQGIYKRRRNAIRKIKDSSNMIYIPSPIAPHLGGDDNE